MNKFRLEAKVDNTGLEEIIKSAGIEYPHESLGFFKTVYAEFETKNKNGVILADSVKEQVSQLIGCQVNFEHKRTDNVCGSIIGSWVNENNQIEVAFSFYKSIYPMEYECALSLLEKGKLTVSFELMVDDKDVEITNDGSRRLKEVSFDGMGLLMSNSPACPNAIVYEQADIDRFRKQDLIFAKKIENEINKEEEIVEKKANDALLAKQKEMLISEFGEEAVADWTDEDFLNEDKIIALREEITKAKEDSYECECLDCNKIFTSETHCKDTKCPECGGETRRKDRPSSGDKASEEAQEEDSKEESAEDASPEEAKTVVKTEVVEEYDENTEKVEKNQEVEIDGEKKMEVKETYEVTYSKEDIEEMQIAYETELAEKNDEIEMLKANAMMIAELKVELGEFVKDFSDEDFLDNDKVKIARLEKENSELKAQTTLETASEEEKAEDETEEATEDVSDETPAEEVKEEQAEEEKEEADVNEEDVDEVEEKAEEVKEEESDMSAGHEDADAEEEDELSQDELLSLAIKNRCK